MIIFDENIDQQVVEYFKKKYDTFSILKECPGISDLEVIDIVKSKGKLLVTEDKDFGELVFAHKIKHISILLLRYKKTDTDTIIMNIENVLENYYKKVGFFFITITKSNIRIKSI